jgi:hypothetical protein
MATKKSSRSAAPAVKARKTAASKAPTRKTPARKALVSKTATRKAPALKSKGKGGPLAGREPDFDPLWMKTWPRIIARAWSDPSFMDRLKSAPMDVFKEYNLPLIPDFEYAIRQGTGRPLVTLSVPPKPAGAGNESVGDITYENDSPRPTTCTNTCCI